MRVNCLIVLWVFVSAGMSAHSTPPAAPPDSVPGQLIKALCAGQPVKKPNHEFNCYNEVRLHYSEQSQHPVRLTLLICSFPQFETVECLRAAKAYLITNRPSEAVTSVVKDNSAKCEEKYGADFLSGKPHSRAKMENCLRSAFDQAKSKLPPRETDPASSDTSGGANR